MATKPALHTQLKTPDARFQCGPDSAGTQLGQGWKHHSDPLLTQHTDRYVMSSMSLKQPDITRDKILDAAFQEIHRHGFQSASLSNILASTELTKGALYHHFPTKNDLGHAVIDEIIRSGLDAMVLAPLRESDDPIETLLEIIQRKSERTTLESVILGCPLNNLAQEMSPLDEDFKQRLNSILTEWHNTFADALKRAQKQGKVRKDVDCRAAALFLVSAWEGCVGVAKNLQSVKEFRLCLKQLEAYVRSLLV